MPKSCCLVECNNQPKDSNRTFHRFPSDITRRNNWIEITHIQNWTPNKYICSQHFLDSDFDKDGHRVRLRNNVVPSVNITHTNVPINKPVMIKEGVLQELLTSNAANSAANDLNGPQKIPCNVDRNYSSTLSMVKSPIKSYEEENKENRCSPGDMTFMDEHDYCTSPRKAKLKRKLEETQDKLQICRKKLKLANEKNKRLQCKVSNMKEVVVDLKQQLLLSHSAAELIETKFSGISLDLFKRMENNGSTVSREKYPPALRSFALTLQFYSTKAYNYVRETLSCALPCPSTLRQWYTQINGDVGFTAESFNALKQVCKNEAERGKKIQCALIIDEMAIRKHLEWDHINEKYRGYVDMGTDIQGEELPMATEALVFMVVAINSNWKLPIAYFFIASLTAEERANLISMALIKLYECQVNVVSLTCDGPSCHKSMLSKLGACLDLDNPKPYFDHPCDSSKRIYVFLDVCHMLKLMRNAWEFLKRFIDNNGRYIEWTYILHLHEQQKASGLRLGNKLSKKHIEFKKQIMKVNLAAQTLSKSVADAIEFCDKDLKLQKFKDSSSTSGFIKFIDQLFDALNSRSPVACGTKSPLRKSNENHWRIFLNEALIYIKELKDPSGTPLHKTPRCTAVVGFYISTLSAIALFDNLVDSPQSQLSYILTYKFSQDHIELFFCAIRGRGGWNNNPTVAQFTSAYKKLLIHHEIKINTGNAAAQDATKILFVTKDKVQSKDKSVDVTDVTDMRRTTMDPPPEDDDDIITEVVDELPNLSRFDENVVTYISGYVGRMIKRRIMCQICVEACIKYIIPEKNDTYTLLKRKNRGGLTIPSPEVISICFQMERLLQYNKVLLGDLTKLNLYPQLRIKFLWVPKKRNLYF